MSMMDNLKVNMKEAQEVIDEFLTSPCCDEDEDSGKKKNNIKKKV